MCRLLATSNMKVTSKDLLSLQISNGGEGDGFITLEKQVVPKSYEGITTKKEHVGSFWIHRFLGKEYTWEYEETKVVQGQLRKIPKTRKEYDALHYRRLPHTFLYHTRIASRGEVSLQKTHPAVGKRYLVMQNGTETITYKAETDFESALFLLEDGLIQPEALAYITTSNWFIVDTEEYTVYFVSGKAYDPLVITYIDESHFIIASEPIPSYEKQKWYEFHGILQGTIDVDTNTITLDFCDAPIFYEHVSTHNKWHWYDSYYYYYEEEDTKTNDDTNTHYDEEFVDNRDIPSFIQNKKKKFKR